MKLKRHSLSLAIVDQLNYDTARFEAKRRIAEEEEERRAEHASFVLRETLPVVTPPDQFLGE